MNSWVYRQLSILKAQVCQNPMLFWSKFVNLLKKVIPECRGGTWSNQNRRRKQTFHQDYSRLGHFYRHAPSHPPFSSDRSALLNSSGQYLAAKVRHLEAPRNRHSCPGNYLPIPGIRPSIAIWQMKTFCYLIPIF